MKYIKIFALVVSVVLFAACSGDDTAMNSTSASIGFSQDTIKVKETVGYFNVPIVVTGKLNGDVKVNVAITPSNDNPATADVNYMVTDPTVTIAAGDSVANIQIKAIDDRDINVDRKFNVTITADGATVSKSDIVVVLRDNDASFYEAFAGKWTLSFLLSDDTPTSKTITLSGVDENAPDYNNILTAEGLGLINIGVDLDIVWHFRYSFDATSKTGTLGFIMDEKVSEYPPNYSFIWAGDGGNDYSYEDLTATWALGEGNVLPTEITFPEGQPVYLVDPDKGWFDLMYNIKMTRQ